jgi:general secretion pathway protein K
MSRPVLSCRLHNQQGIALIVTLLALVMITAMVVEFSYGVYTGTNSLYNWRDSQRLSLMAQSGVNVAARVMKEAANIESYKTQGEIEMPVANPFGDFQGTITVRIEDESAKFNINTIVSLKGEKLTYDSFVTLLTILNLDVKIADRIADWIVAKNTYLDSTDELLLIHGISREDYDKLLPYITVHGEKTNLYINVNRATMPVLRSMSHSINEGAATTIINAREFMPFSDTADFTRRTSIISLDPNVYAITEGSYFFVKSSASSEGVKRIVEMVLNLGNNTVEYWKEY